MLSLNILSKRGVLVVVLIASHVSSKCTRLKRFRNYNERYIAEKEKKVRVVSDQSYVKAYSLSFGRITDFSA